MTNTVKFTPEMRDQLRATHAEAVKLHQDSFTFNELEYDTGYAQYLLEFLDQKFGPTTTKGKQHHG